ncbi:hypothetical protein [Methylobacterium symbioticum]|mgnify:CR=1 FL=1|uniref:Uncharacterized protein n=1 Tax=Methylobacterium symbioticum TaxID=2584084 RepID=A0A509EHH1_9HYPH|nr:hypothetical protein [Methylobacterium symbioticum]VUD72899.1 hypothetical protein MET9862_03506 [Methylobacterium symbioticum]
MSMTMNWLIDRLLMLGLVAIIAAAVVVLSAAGFRYAGETCGFAALVASLVSAWLRR